MWNYFINHKTEVFSIFKKWKAQVENHTGKNIKYLRTNNGLENREKEFLKLCESKGITITSQSKKLHNKLWGSRENEPSWARAKIEKTLMKKMLIFF